MRCRGPRLSGDSAISSRPDSCAQALSAPHRRTPVPGPLATHSHRPTLLGPPISPPRTPRSLSALPRRHHTGGPARRPADQPPSQRTGRDLLAALQQRQARTAPLSPSAAPAVDFLSGRRTSRRFAGSACAWRTFNMHTSVTSFTWTSSRQISSSPPMVSRCCWTFTWRVGHCWPVRRPQRAWGAPPGTWPPSTRRRWKRSGKAGRSPRVWTDGPTSTPWPW